MVYGGATGGIPADRVRARSRDGRSTGAEAPPIPATLWLCRAAIVLGWAMILAGLALSGWGCLLWLRDGHWTHAALADLWGRPPPGGLDGAAGWDDMRGLHLILVRVLHWLGRFPISLALLVLGCATAWIGNGFHDRGERALARRAPRRGGPSFSDRRPTRP